MGTGEALVLGVVQGLTEFLPVSSSGHLVLAQAALAVDSPGTALEVFVHLGTALAVICVFARQVGRLVLGVGRGTHSLFAGRLGSQIRQNADLRMVLLILWGSIPAAVAGLALEAYVERLFSSPFLVSLALIVTGAGLWSTRFAATSQGNVGWKDAIWIGLAQALALVPGISRSGATISVGLHRGVERQQAAEYSFLLALPAILGATVLKLKEVAGAPDLIPERMPLLVAVVGAFCSGYVAIRLLLHVVRRGRLSTFAYYCWAVGGLGLVLSVAA